MDRYSTRSGRPRVGRRARSGEAQLVAQVLRVRRSRDRVGPDVGWLGLLVGVVLLVLGVGTGSACVLLGCAPGPPVRIQEYLDSSWSGPPPEKPLA